ncbi:MAG: RNA chaperone Hfq [Leptonema illini]|jgi:host factor-I protein|uniref:Host factor I-like protein n=2 Tax=Leptonema illini TaxID=183 RepID=H2CG74_9LEPT|nr:RNA chaperone Hfq [Leptonema illini]EHQ05755.1 host factor I-like protein [Leptonema illini DSM 21528]KAB2934054.1 MAG: RNA chaperone Hfq [Leptonema illini]PKL32376.1 MAG: RNA chaperone Hfq [Spirochaetae bacterium HGW-Spirochaetae-10]
MPKQYGAIEQNQLIEKARKRSMAIQIFLKSGVPIRGKVIAHDNHSVFIVTEQGQVLIYKHAISSLSPSRPPARKR